MVSSAPVTDPRSASPGGLRLGPAPAGLPDPNLAPPVVADGKIFAIDADAQVSAFDAGTGKVLWQMKLPTQADPGDPFAVVRVLELVTRVEAGRAVLLDDLVASLNARYLDWAFDRAVVADALVRLQANWMADFRNASGIQSRPRRWRTSTAGT